MIKILNYKWEIFILKLNGQVNRADAAVDVVEGSWELTSVTVWEPLWEPVFGTGKIQFRTVRGWGVTICKLRVLGATKCLQIEERWIRRKHQFLGRRTFGGRAGIAKHHAELHTKTRSKAFQPYSLEKTRRSEVVTGSKKGFMESSK